MDSTVFDEWMTGFNKYMALRKRKVWLLMDNSSTHALPVGATLKWWTAGGDEDTNVRLRGFVMSNVNVVFLPPNTTSIVQPLDAGIIANAKCFWRQQHVAWVVGQVDEAYAAWEQSGKPSMLEAEVRTADHHKCNVRQAIEWLQTAWRAVKQETIARCWIKVDILPAAMRDSLVNDFGKVHAVTNVTRNHALMAVQPGELDTLADLMKQLSTKVTQGQMAEGQCPVGELIMMHEEDWTEAPNEDVQVQTEADISLAAAQMEAVEEDDDIVDDSTASVPITRQQALAALERVQSFLSECRSETDSDTVMKKLDQASAHLRNLGLLLIGVQILSGKQSTLNQFFSPSKQ